MEKATRALAFVLAGGEGRRLAPLTRHVAKPVVPFHTHHRLIDFALSNLRNSGLQSIHVLMQYQARSVRQHLMSSWRADRPDPDGFINPVTGGLGGMDCFDGTAAAVYRNRQEIIDFGPDVVAVFSADHVYRMDVQQMIDFHLACGADATVAALPVCVSEAHAFGVIEAAPDGRIRSFAEKPQRPMQMPGRPGHAFASMGNYLFSPRVLLQALDATQAAGGTDFGSDLLPALVSSHRLMAYDFTTNLVRGAPTDVDPHYWRDVGTIDAYFAAHMDTLGASPRFDVSNRGWPIRGRASKLESVRPAALSLEGYRSLAAVPRSAQVDQSILRERVSIGECAVLSRCIVSDNVVIGAGCHLRNVIIDQDNYLPDGFEAGPGVSQDRHVLPVSDEGVVVIPRGYFPATVATGRRRKVALLTASRFANAPAWAARGPETVATGS